MANVLKGKVALVTAGTAGLGAAAARALASEGMRVVINYSANSQRADALLESLLEEFSDESMSDDDEIGYRFIAIRADLGCRADVTQLVDETIGNMLRLDVVVSNGGWTRFSNFTDLEDGVDEADWDRCFNMNVKSHLWLMHAAKKHLDETEGAFITTASLAGVIPSGSSLVKCPQLVLSEIPLLKPTRQAYAVTKAAQIHLVKSLATIVGPKIRCNSVSPAILLTVSDIHENQSIYSLLTVTVGLGSQVLR